MIEKYSNVKYQTADIYASFGNFACIINSILVIKRDW